MRETRKTENVLTAKINETCKTIECLESTIIDWKGDVLLILLLLLYK